MAASANLLDTKSLPAAKRSAADIWLSALTYWYLTELLAAIGLSFGLYFVHPLSVNMLKDRNWRDAFSWMDGRWYKQIATEGYDYDPHKNTNIAFFPVYPLLGRAVMRLTGLRPEVALLICSNVTLLAALAMLAFYVRDRYPNSPADLADYTILAAALFPTGCFFRLAYSESTFLLLAILAMYGMLRRWPLWAIAPVVGLATAARPVGVALLAPFAIHIIRRSSSRPRSSSGSGAALPLRSQEGRGEGACFKSTPPLRLSLTLSVARRLALYLPFATWGLAAFIVYQYFEFGEPLAFARVQKNWGMPAVDWQGKIVPLVTLQPIWSVYDSRSPALWLHADPHGVPWFSLQFANPIFFISAIALIALGACLTWKSPPSGTAKSLSSSGRLGEEAKAPALRTLDEGTPARWISPEEISLSALLLLIPYVTRAYEMGMGSMGRFVAVVFPIYLVLGRFFVHWPSALRAAMLALAGFFLATYVALYAARYVIF